MNACRGSFRVIREPHQNAHELLGYMGTAGFPAQSRCLEYLLNIPSRGRHLSLWPPLQKDFGRKPEWRTLCEGLAICSLGRSYVLVCFLLLVPRVATKTPRFHNNLCMGLSKRTYKNDGFGCQCWIASGFLLQPLPLEWRPKSPSIPRHNP